MRPLLIAGIWGAFICTGAAVVDKVATPEPQQQMWVSAPSNVFPKGTQMQIVEGDPWQAGPYFVRVKFANGKVVEMKGEGPLTRE